MGAYHRAVNNDMLHVWIIDKVLMHSFPHALFAPAFKASVDAVPLPVLLSKTLGTERHHSPLGTGSSLPEYGFDEATALGFLTNVNTWTGTQK